MAQPTVSIIVVSYNTRETTLACLRSVYEQTQGIPFELIVVDNASQDGSADAVANLFPQARLIRADANLGFGRANNRAAAKATGKNLLLLNSDTIVLDHAVERLIAFTQRRPEARIWGGLTVFDDRSLNPACCWRRMTLWNQFCRAIGLSTAFPNSAIFNTEGYGGWRRDSERRVDIVSGCFFLIRRSLWMELGGFDSDFFMYGEEADLCLRARQLGARPRFTPDATIVHFGGASARARTDKHVQLLRAKMVLMDRHWRRPSAMIGHLLLKTSVWIRGSLGGKVLERWFRPKRGSRASVWSDVWRRRMEWCVH